MSSRLRHSHVAGCGRSGHRSTSLATGGTAAATGPGARSASPRLPARCGTSTLPCRMSSPAPALPAAAHPSHCRAFNLLLHRPARPTAVTTVVGAEVAGVLSADRRSILDVYVLFLLLLRRCRSLPDGLELQGGAQRRLWRRRRSAATTRQLGCAARASPAAQAALHRSHLWCLPIRSVDEKCSAQCAVFRVCTSACLHTMCVPDAPHLSLHEGMRGVA